DGTSVREGGQLPHAGPGQPPDERRDTRLRRPDAPAAPGRSYLGIGSDWLGRQCRLCPRRLGARRSDFTQHRRAVRPVRGSARRGPVRAVRGRLRAGGPALEERMGKMKTAKPVLALFVLASGAVLASPKPAYRADPRLAVPVEPGPGGVYSFDQLESAIA